VLLATERMARAGYFADATLEPVAFPPGSGNQAGFLEAHLDAPWFAGLTDDERDGLRAVARRAAAVTGRSSRIALVHADFNPKNLLVDPATGGVTGVLDWEYAYAGAPLADVGNLLRFAEDEVFDGAVAAAYADRAPDVPDGWIEVARALDLYSLIDLAAREAREAREAPANPVVAGARRLLLATAHTRTLAAHRPDPTT
jgi:aminoglycoside phosphotransferase (APT) family kinase protein